MRSAERIVIALRALGETGQSAAGSKRANPVATPSEDLVRVGLMPDVPDQPIARRIEHVVQGGGQFDDTEAGAEMPARHRNCIDGFLTQLVGDLPYLFHLEPTQIVGGADRRSEEHTS